ncbi:MAG: ATP-binding cassette domain-containing protein [Bacteroidetes bacterium]|nr:ATP-binding cassette domain-containing protein [Bacteroidota bacterium]
MSERILRALMQMFAIIAKVDGITNTGRSIVESFLKQQLNQEQVETYLKIFDEYLEAHQSVSKKKDGSAKRTSLNSVKVLKICTQINQELEQPQKVIVLIRLLEFIYSSAEISDQEYEFVVTVADTFNIPNEEFQQLKSFVEDKADKIPDSPDILVINNKEGGYNNHCKHIYVDTLNDDVRVIQINSVGMYALRIYGNIELQLNGQGISKERVHILTPGSSLRSSKVKPIYYSDIIGRFLADGSKARISFEAKSIEYKFKGGKLGLRGINMSEESGKLIGIMGGSGAGKSTLLNVLNGVEKPSSGAVLINGKNVHTDKKAVDGVIGHVTQDDLLIEELTVYQNLFYNAKLCFGNLSDDEISKKCHSLLADLGLSETRDLKVGSPLEKTISGGQRKRLNIALELIREPSVLYVDEPTSGLSSRDSENIMDLLKELALKGKLIFVVIHQPSSDIFKMFDKLMILDVGGYPIYYGNPVDAVAYFKRLVNHVNAEESECWNCGNVNPEQIFNIIESKVLDEYGNLTHNRKTSPAEWNKNYKELIESSIVENKHTGDIPEAIFKIPNAFRQFAVFIKRDVLSKLTNTQYLLINFIEAPLLAFILAYLVRYFNTDADTTKGYIYRENENIPAYMFMSVVVALFIGLTVSAEEIIRDRKIRKRESFLNLSKGSYLWSKIIIMFVLSAVQTLTFIVVGNMVLGIKGMYLDYWMVLFTVSCFANMLGLNISSAFNSAVTIYILIPFLIIPQLLLAGVVVKFDKLNPTLAKQGGVPLAGEVMASRWAFEALAVNQFKANEYEKHFYKYDKAISIAQYKKVYWLPKLQSKMAKIDAELKDNSKKNDLAADFTVVRNEIEKEQLVLKNKITFKQLDKLTPEAYNADVASALRAFFTRINDFYIQKENSARTGRDKVVLDMTKTAEAKADYQKLQENYENESLNQLVLNSNDFGERCLEKDGRFIQRVDPIYLDPTGSNLGRAQFFAPNKKFMGKLYPTYWFNILVIWFMSLTLMVTLYFDVFKRVLDLFGNISFKKKRA